MPGFAGKTLKQINVLGLTDDARTRLMSRVPVHVGDILADDTYQNVVAAVNEYDEHMMVGVRTDKDDSVSLRHLRARRQRRAHSPELSARSRQKPRRRRNGMKRINIGGNVQSRRSWSRRPAPAYPPLAKQARISGVVKLQAVIDADGTMRNQAIISGHPLLIPAALEAVRQWVYAPTLLNGDPVEVLTQIDVNFTLSDEIPQQ